MHPCGDADDEPPHVLAVRVEVDRDAALERAEQLRAALAAEAGVPIDALGVYEAWWTGAS